MAAVFLGKMWNAARITHGRTSRLPDFFVYALMASGLVFIVRYFWLGTF